MGRVFDSKGQPVMIDPKCAAHPCYLVMSKTPDSKLSETVHEQSLPECEHADMRNLSQGKNISL